MRPLCFFIGFLISGIYLLFSCKHPTTNNKTKQGLTKNQQPTKKDTHLSKINPATDTSGANNIYNNLATIALPFLPSGQKSNFKISSKEPVLPYTTGEYSSLTALTRKYIAGQRYLVPIDSAFIISKLKGLQPMTVNPNGGTSFGDFDCILDSADCLSTDEYGKIGIVCALKVDSNYLCHIILSHKEWYYNDRGILILITHQGEILDWMFSNGELTVGNPHGNITRMLTIISNSKIKIQEYAFGDNSEHYEFNATFSIRDNKFIVLKRKLLTTQ